MRLLASDFSAVLDDAHTRIFWLVALEFSTPLYLHTDIGDITFDSHTWQGVGDLGSVQQIDETSDLAAPGARISLNGLNPDITARARTELYSGKPADIYLAARDAASGDLVDDPVHILGATMEQMTITDGPEVGAIELLLEDERAIFDRSPNILMSNAQQQERYTGDLCFEFLPDLQELDIQWGLGRTVDLGRRNPAPQYPGQTDEFDENF